MLREEHFWKTMESAKRPGRWQDVYKLHYCSFPVYIKFDRSAKGAVVLLSFKLDEDPR